MGVRVSTDAFGQLMGNKPLSPSTVKLQLVSTESFGQLMGNYSSATSCTTAS